MTSAAGKNPNHPKLGASCRTDPIRSLEAIKAIKKELYRHKNPRNLCLFTLGINTALRASELISLKLKDVSDITVGSRLVVPTPKSKKPREIQLNGACVEVLRDYLGFLKPDLDPESPTYQGEDPLFIGERGPLTKGTLTKLVKKFCKDAGLQGNFGANTLPKTWGYHQVTARSVPLRAISGALRKRTSEAREAEYLGIDTNLAIYGVEL